MLRQLFLLFFISSIHANEVLTVLSDKPLLIATSGSAEIFPKPWRGGKVQASGEVLPEERRKQALLLMESALAKYPAEVLREHLHALYLLSELRYRGVVTSGTNSKRAVYLKMGPVEKGFTAQHIERVFHAEFSSILLRNRPHFLDQKAWKAANPTGFTYLGDGVDAVKQGKARTELDDTLNARGFLNEYGQSTLENDFNGFASRLWTGDEALWQLADQHPAIQRKLVVVLHFYQQLHRKLDEAFFRQLVKPSSRSVK